MILDRLLQTQDEFGAELISDAEIQSIKAIWTEDLLKI
jgi:hypothetical protein